jgi:hypothetical protein
MKNLIAPFLVIALTLLIVYSLKDCKPNAKKALSGRYGLRDTVFLYSEPERDTIVKEVVKWKTKYITKQEYTVVDIWASYEPTDASKALEHVFTGDTNSHSITIHADSLTKGVEDTSIVYTIKDLFKYNYHEGGDTTARYEFYWQAVVRNDGEFMTLVPTITVFPDTIVVQKCNWICRLFKKKNND